MRVARLCFNRLHLFSNDKFTTDTFKELMDHLPKDSKVVGFGSSHNMIVDYIFVKNEIFKDTPEGQEPPDMTVTFGLRPDGTAYCAGVDWKDCMGSTSMQQIPVHVNVSVQYNRCPKSPGICHDYVQYQSQFKVETICKYCGDPKP